MSGIAGQYYLSIDIEGTNIFANHLNTNINIINNMHQNLPVCNITYKDASNICDKLQLADGSPIKVTIGIEDIHLYDLSFIMQGSAKCNPLDSSIGYVMKAVLDKPEMLRKIVDEPFKGTSSGLMQKLASQAGLSFEGDPSQDIMDWLPNRLPFASAMKKYAEKAYAGEASAFIQGVDDSGTFYYKDLNKLASSSATKTFSSNPAEGIQVLMWINEPKDGVYNNLNANGSTSIGMNALGEVLELNKIDMKSFAGSVGGSLMKKAMGSLGGRIEHIPLPTGNTHINWEKSQHTQNRIKSQFSNDLILLVDVPSKVKLFEKVKAIPYSPSSNAPIDRLVKDYIVTAFTRFLYGSRYYEKITLTSNREG